MAPLCILLVGGLIASAILVVRGNKSVSPSVVLDCRAVNKTEDFECWRVRFESQVMAGQTMQAFEEAKKAYEEIQYVKTNCHQLAHVIGRASGKKHGDVAKAYAEGDNWCWSGFYHGVMESIAGELGVEKVLADINKICTDLRKKSEYSFDH